MRKQLRNQIMVECHNIIGPKVSTQSGHAHFPVRCGDGPSLCRHWLHRGPPPHVIPERTPRTTPEAQPTSMYVDVVWVMIACRHSAFRTPLLFLFLNDCLLPYGSNFALSMYFTMLYRIHSNNNIIAYRSDDFFLLFFMIIIITHKMYECVCVWCSSS